MNNELNNNKKQSTNNNSSHKSLYFVLTSLISLVGLVLLCVSFYVPPTGVIDKTVLIAFAECAIFVSTLMWIRYEHIYQNPPKKKKD
jgi:hypothetical protein